MVEAYSRLNRVLTMRNLTVPELHRRIQRAGIRIALKTLYRLRNAEQPLERLDLRVAGAICRICRTPLSEWIVFQKPHGKIRHLPTAKQKRLDALQSKNNQGLLAGAELEELRELVRETEELALENARRLTEQR